MPRIRSIAKELLRRVGLQRIPKHPPPRITKAMIASVLPPSPVIVEAGAHVGWDTESMSAEIPGCTVHAFEPVPDVFRQLTERTRDLPRVHRYPFALGERPGTARINVSGGGSNASSSLLAPAAHLKVAPHVTFDSQADVTVVTLDGWAREHNVCRVDFLWLDLQGFELAALRGATEVLRTVTAAFVEVSLIELYAGAPLYHELRAWMEERGFVVREVDFAYPDAGDVLFVRANA